MSYIEVTILFVALEDLLISPLFTLTLFCHDANWANLKFVSQNVGILVFQCTAIWKKRTNSVEIRKPPVSYNTFRA